MMGLICFDDIATYKLRKRLIKYEISYDDEHLPLYAKIPKFS